jgi:hypothetical protein
MRTYAILPELEESEFNFAALLGPRIEDSNEMGERYAEFSISMDDDFSCSDEADW